MPNKIGDAGADGFAALIQSGAKLREIDLSRNEISLKGVNKLIEALDQNLFITRLTLGKQLPGFLKNKVKTLLERNKEASGADELTRPDLGQIQSVYRTQD